MTRPTTPGPLHVAPLPDWSLCSRVLIGGTQTAHASQWLNSQSDPHLTGVVIKDEPHWAGSSHHPNHHQTVWLCVWEPVQGDPIARPPFPHPRETPARVATQITPAPCAAGRPPPLHPHTSPLLSNHGCSGARSSDASPDPTRRRIASRETRSALAPECTLQNIPQAGLHRPAIGTASRAGRPNLTAPASPPDAAGFRPQRGRVRPQGTPTRCAPTTSAGQHRVSTGSGADDGGFGGSTHTTGFQPGEGFFPDTRVRMDRPVWSAGRGDKTLK